MGNRHVPSGGVSDPLALAELAAIVETMRTNALAYPEGSVERFLRLETADEFERTAHALLDERRVRRGAN
jgi:hypothetical protein